MQNAGRLKAIWVKVHLHSQRWKEMYKTEGRIAEQKWEEKMAYGARSCEVIIARELEVVRRKMASFLPEELKSHQTSIVRVESATL